jgi:hypothetical protein
MYEAQAIGTADNLAKCGLDFTIVGRSKDSDDRRHGPCLSQACVRPSDTIQSQVSYDNCFGIKISYALMTGPRIKYGLSLLRMNLRVFW